MPIDFSHYFNDVFAEQLKVGITCNSPKQDEKPGATDKAILQLLTRGDIDMKEISAKYNIESGGDFIRFPFSSKRKRMSTIIKGGEGDGFEKRLLIKGASEIVKACCSHYLDADGNRQEMTDAKDNELEGIITTYAEDALRTIVIAYKDISAGECGEKHDEPEDEEIKDIEKSGLTLITILGIMDIVRQEVPESVRIV